MTPQQRIWYWIQGWWSCISWIPGVIVKEWLPDLAIWNPPTHPNDFIWYAERVNGRLAMLAALTILCVDFLTKDSIWHTIHVL